MQDLKMTEDSKVTIPAEVQETISKVLVSDDPLDQCDFDAIEYINTIFPTEQSLTNIDDVLSKMKDKIRNLDQDIRRVVRGQSDVETEGRAALDEVRRVIGVLTSNIGEMKEQAKKSEQMVNEITADIKQLDNAKRNLTSSITMLNNLHILVEGVDKLSEACTKRNYGTAAGILQSVNDVLNQLDKHRHIPQIKQLVGQINGITDQLAEQIKADFKSVIEGRPKSKQGAAISQNQLRLLAEACLVVSTMNPDGEKNLVKDQLLEWFIDSELEEYKALFQDNQDLAWLDKIDKRYNWLKKHLIEFEERFGRMFPPKWEVSECIAVEFCKLTANQLSKVMMNRANEMNVRLLLFAFDKTSAFENLLNQRFTGVTLINDEMSKENLLNPFSGLITHCFEPHLKIYVEAQEKNLSQLIDEFVDKYQKQKFTNDRNVSEVFPSAGMLFSQYKNCLVRCVQLSTGRPLVELSFKFKKNLEEYATRVLNNNLPRLKTTSLSASGVSVINAAISATGLLQISLKEGEVVRYTKQELCQICCILLTANYCLETVQQLEKKLQEKVDKQYLDKINLSSEQDLFHRIILNCIDLLIQDIESGCELGFSLMIKTQWSTIGTPIDQSPYVKLIVDNLQQIFPFIRENLQDARKYFTQLCNRFAQVFIPKFIGYLFRCKPLRQEGAEQLLLDTHLLKKVLQELPGWESNVKSAPASYVKEVIRGMTKAEMILKVVLVPHRDVNHYIESYAKLLPDSNMEEFVKILDMKGVRRPESTLIIDSYKSLLIK
ncbi:vacuolar protein sorting-associated protein 53 homolog [Tetranychus urticae]|uniref:Vacuolar protein sorting-associated protein 53 homolog n=1 Tax=Tetranychus urticae TaxID=32264 RepID=T1KZQ4_TETUR|nr:vacuolar protein sorting-associated protein 53 homolog [Tetranychus urticae]